MKKIVRREGVIAFLGLILIGIIYSQIFLEFHLKYLLENSLSQLNGAKVTIRDLDIRWLQKTAHLRGIEVGSATSPMKNLFEIDEVNFAFFMRPLFRKKLIVDHLTATGFNIGTVRTTSAYIQYDPRSNSIPIAILDRAAEGLYSGIRNQLAQNPLRFLGYLAGGVDIHSKLELFHAQLKTVNELRTAVEALSALHTQWQSQMKSIPTVAELTMMLDEVKNLSKLSAAEAATTKRQLAEAYTKKAKSLDASQVVERDYRGIRGKLDSLDDFIQDDVKFVRDKLNLPRLDLDDFSFYVFGEPTLQILERVAYWLDLSRRYMPVSPQHHESAFTVQGEGIGQTRVHFGSRSGTPSILIRKTVISSRSDAGPTLGDVNAIIEGFTVDPSILGSPMTIELQADFPHHHFRHMNFVATIDHTGLTPKEDFSVQIETLPLQDTTLHSSQDLRLAIQRAKASLDFSGKSLGNALTYKWNTKFYEVDFEVTSRYKLAEEAVQTLLRDMYVFQVTGSGVGDQRELALDIHSEVGTHLSEGLRHNFRHQLAAIDDNLRLNLRDQVISERLRLEEKLQEFENHSLAQYRRVKDLLETLKDRLDS